MPVKKITLYVIFLNLIVHIHAASLSIAAADSTSLSFQGFTGLINSPNACVTREGNVDLLYSNQIEQERRFQDATDNYMFSLGLFSNIEIGGRLVEEDPHYPEGLRDLSGNIKIQIPFIPTHSLFPRIALGIRDWGGGAGHFRTFYGVISKQIWHSRISLGYGDGPDISSMDGVFGGIECFVFDWFHLLLENDSKETNGGIRLVSPNNKVMEGFNVALTGKTSFDHHPGEFEFSFLCRLPLGRRHAGKKDSGIGPIYRKETSKTHERSPSSLTQELPLSAHAEEATSPSGGDLPLPPDETLKTLKKELIAQGFENIKLGTGHSNALYIEYENNRFNRNEVDGLGLLLGIASHSAAGKFKTLSITVKKNKLPIFRLSGPVDAIKSFFDAHEPAHAANILKNKLTIHEGKTNDDAIEFFDPHIKNSSVFKPRLSLYPGLKTFIGTEEGAFNGLLSLKSEVTLPLWIGNELDFRWDIPLCWSRDFDDDGPYAGNRNDARLERAMVHQTFAIPYLKAMVSYGLYQHDVYGVMGESFWMSGSGRHRLRVKGGTFEDKNNDSDHDVWIGGYRYYFSPLDLFFEITGGKYWYQDKGYTLELKRFFEDTCITLFYQDTDDPIGGKAAGIKISLPLTPRRDMKPSFFQVKGSDQWSYYQQTTVHDQGEGNPINMNIAIEPRTARSLERVYCNRDRLNELYINAHLLRMWDAYNKYADD